MRLLADECVSGAVVAALRRVGHDVGWCAEIAPAEADEQVLARSVEDDRILITRDQDFGDLVFRLGHRAIGIVRIRIDPLLGASVVASEVQRRMERLGESALRGWFTVLETDRTRQRALPPAADRG